MRRDEMQQTALRLGAVFGAGAVLYAIKQYREDSLHACVRERERLVREVPHIASLLSSLAPLDETAIRPVLDLMERVVTLDAQGGKVNQWHISRANGEIVRRVRAMCDKIPISASEEHVQTLLVAKDDYVPQLEGALDDLLHNHLLRIM